MLSQARAPLIKVIDLHRPVEPVTAFRASLNYFRVYCLPAESITLAMKQLAGTG